MKFVLFKQGDFQAGFVVFSGMILVWVVFMIMGIMGRLSEEISLSGGIEMSIPLLPLFGLSIFCFRIGFNPSRFEKLNSRLNKN